MPRPPKIPAGKTIQRQARRGAAISSDDGRLRAMTEEALVKHQQGLLIEAKNSYLDILKLNPSYFDALQLLGVLTHQLGEHLSAVALIDRAIAINPNQPATYNNKGLALLELGRFDQAIQSFNHAVLLKPDYWEAFNNKGIACLKVGQVQDAILSYARALELNPNYAEAYFNRAVALKETGNTPAALSNYDQAIKVKPSYAVAHLNRGVLLRELKQLPAAIASYDQAILFKPDYAEAYHNRGNALRDLRRIKDAVADFENAVRYKPRYHEAYLNLGVSLYELGQYEAALESYNKAIEIHPDFTEAYLNKGDLLKLKKKFEEALICFTRALDLQPNFKYLFGSRLHNLVSICNWDDYDSQILEFEKRANNNERVSPLFAALVFTSSSEILKKVALVYSKDENPENFQLGKLAIRAPKKKIRLAYYSADLHNHPIAYLIAELFELHDRNRFEVICFSFGPEGDNQMRSRIMAGFDQFIDVRNKTDLEVASLSREMEIDIAIDLNGFTTHCRTNIFAHRAAPIQVNYLGFPGTMGADYMDYLIADPTVIPKDSQQHYSEKIAYLPHAYQPNDSKRKISDVSFTRAQLGLPESGFVFCCFNNNYKITPSTFDAWMRILKAVEGSVLWLLSDNQTAEANLRSQMRARGVDDSRLIFAKRLTLAEHLARHRAADLFLDTLPYNAHTTASDALWAGLPVLTQMGTTFPGRVAASLLKAVKLPELITHTTEQYEALAIDLATHPEKLAQIREKLAANRLTTPLFDTPTFAKHIETAYEQMMERYWAGLAPDHIEVRSLLGE